MLVGMKILVVLLACVANMVECEMFTSMAHLQTALYAERDIASTLRQYIDMEEKRLEKLKSIANDFASHSNVALKNPDGTLGNPVSAFLYVKRFTIDWDREIEPILQNNTFTTMLQQIKFLKQDLPTYEDLSGAAAALLRLQDTYQLDTAKIASGELGKTKCAELSANDCYEIGRLSYNDEDFYHTTLWMQEAIERIQADINSTLSKSTVLDYLAFALYRQGNIQHALSLTNELLKIDPYHERARNNRGYYQRMIKEEAKSRKMGDDGEGISHEIKNKRHIDDYRNSNEFLTYESLCRGERTQKVKDEEKLSCRYKHNNHPLLLLRPAKEEDVHLDPWIVIYHDAMLDGEIQTIKQIATPKLNRATVQNAKTGALETANYRISKSAWLKDDDHEVVHRVNKRIEAITGLTLKTAEELQIANYGLGGHYEPHFDFARVNKKKEEKDAFKSLGTGNRIATFLFYMSDVEAGGATVFPYIGVKLFPKKGAAAFWYNLYKSGEGIYNTRHAACPVLVGVKWVSNKWIHERGQEFLRPCGKKFEE
ncbi:prolyl 4-hydroxylase subunit alpha-2 isoform X1 [Patella vulgata]|uniref:prolyl 4-hydroxylase subunit alpha-2 isoform X1 n=1 Tax=Patella vulgata TaxID=6465 RepID=UPI00217FE826|nr:prolyl 4-hydroxylase subunit alpha-2 isoform X1 [Patella vulgata]